MKILTKGDLLFSLFGRHTRVSRRCSSKQFKAQLLSPAIHSSREGKRSHSTASLREKFLSRKVSETFRALFACLCARFENFKRRPASCTGELRIARTYILTYMFCECRARKRRNNHFLVTRTRFYTISTTPKHFSIIGLTSLCHKTTTPTHARRPSPLTQDDQTLSRKTTL